jgi:Cytochrome c552
MSVNAESPTRSRGLFVAVLVLAGVVAAGAAALLVNISERKQEARTPGVRVVAIDDETVDPAVQQGAQFLLDFVEAENSTGFHAPQEATRILGESIDFARQGQIALRDGSFKPTVPVVAIAASTSAAPAAPTAIPATSKQ